jgi:hypothetical protein
MHKIQEISSRDESKRRGFLFTRLDRKYVYAIDFLNVDNEAERVEVAFDSKELSKEFDSLLNSRK